MASAKPPKAASTAPKPTAFRNPPLPYSYKANVSAQAPRRAPPTATEASIMDLPQSLRTPAPKPADLSSQAYKAASRKYVGFMVAMPILLVTSYVLFDRLALGHKAKTFNRDAAATDAV